MPHKPAPKKATPAPAKPDYGVKFLQVRLTPADREHVKKEVSISPENLVSSLQAIVEQSIKVSFAYGEKNDAIICTFTATAHDSAGNPAKLAYSSFGPDVSVALALSLYKHNTMFDGDINNWSEQLDTDDWG